MADTPRVTVAIPLHRGRRWADNVLGNIARLRGHALLLISDAHEHDDGLRQIRERVGDRDEVRFVGRRDLPAGWVPHYNDLMRRVATPLMMWLAQDDEIDADWVAGGERVLCGNRDAMIASGIIRAVEEDGCERAGLTIVGSSLLEGPERDARISAAVEFLCRDWGPIGLPFRGIFRRERALPLHESRPAGEWADILWLLGMVARGPLATTPDAVYGKRFYPSSEHVWWSSFARSPDSVPLTLGSLRASLGRDDLAAIAAAWRGDRTALLRLLTDAEGHLAFAGDAVQERDRRIASLTAELAETHAARAHAVGRAEAAAADGERRAREAAEALATVLGSRSWRLTGPVRRIAAGARRRLGGP
jgi:hypothetical protein